MKSKILLFLTVALGAFFTAADPVLAQGTAFTYQGRLNDGANVANGTYDLTFALFNVVSGAGQLGNTFTNSTTTVSNGLFTVVLDFGVNFPGADRWLEIGVRTNSNGLFSTLSPRQKITPAPYAILAGSVGSNGLAAGTYANAVNFNNPANSFSGNGTGLTNVNAATLGGLGAGNFWIVGGNAGTGGAGLGTVDNQPLKLIAGNRRALQLETRSVSLGLFDSWSAVNTLGGASGNVISNGVMGGTIAGGGAVTNHLFGSEAGPNTVFGNFGTVGGGLKNTAGYASTNFDDARAATVAGGENNTAGNAWATVGGGQFNTAIGVFATVGGGQLNINSGFYATVGGGAGNTNSGFVATVGGGLKNTSGGSAATVGGGSANTSSGTGATVPGGALNSAAGDYSFAAGLQARANHAGTFVWGDSTEADFASTATNQFLIRASGGVGIGTGSPGAQLDVASSGNTTIRISGPVGGGPGVAVACEFATYSPGLNPASARILATDDGNWSNDLDLMTKVPGAAGNALQSRLHVASGGNIGIGTNNPSQKLHVIGNILASGTVTGSSDRNVKEHFASVNPRDVLEKVSALPITEWNYIADHETLRHIGPMAQDFYAAFNVGMDDKHISMVDADGVALAAIQGLNQKVEARDAEIAALKERLEKLEQLIKSQNHGSHQN